MCTHKKIEKVGRGLWPSRLMTYPHRYLPTSLREVLRAGAKRCRRESSSPGGFALSSLRSQRLCFGGVGPVENGKNCRFWRPNLKILQIFIVFLAICSRVLGEAAMPERIVCLAPSYDETLIELGLQDRIVGVTTSSDYLEEVKRAERVGLWVKPNIEKIVALKPDLVLASGFTGQQSAVKKLSALGLRVVVLDETQGIEEIFAKTKQVGNIAGAHDRTEALLERMRKVVEETRHKTARLTRPRVYVEAGCDPLFTCGKGSFINDMVEIAGGKNIAGEINQPFPRISSEFVLSKDPEVIILPYMGRNFGKETLKQRTGWANVSAIRTGRVYDDIGSPIITIPSPRLILYGLPELLKRIHPEITEGTESDPPRLSATPPKEGN